MFCSSYMNFSIPPTIVVFFYFLQQKLYFSLYLNLGSIHLLSRTKIPRFNLVKWFLKKVMQLISKSYATTVQHKHIRIQHFSLVISRNK
jgi:hypothetical protein